MKAPGGVLKPVLPSREEDRPPRAWRVRQVARQLGMPSSSIYRAIERGDLVAVRIGRSLIVLADDLDAFLRERRGGNAA